MFDYTMNLIELGLLLMPLLLLLSIGAFITDVVIPEIQRRKNEDK